MPTVLGPAFKTYPENVPPRMSPEDFEIYIRWSKENLPGAENLYFDCGLGSGAPMPEGIEPELARMWLKNTQRRADLIAEWADVVWIVEFRYDANPNAVGRLLMYQLLWEKDPVIKKPLKLLLITDILNKDLAKLAEKYKIHYEVV